jgi:hypothetical protein
MDYTHFSSLRRTLIRAEYNNIEIILLDYFYKIFMYLLQSIDNKYTLEYTVIY